MSTTTTTTTASALPEIASLRLSGQPEAKQSLKRTPIRYSGSLDKFSRFDNTPSIGTEFRANREDPSKNPSITEILKDEQQTRDLAVLVAERGVVFFREQDVSPEDEKRLVDALGKATGKPSTSGLHIHPLTLGGSELGDEISVIASDYVFDAKFKRNDAPQPWNKPKGSVGWHTDITFEPTPSDYAVLQIHTFPESGGDTLWASAYEAYDRLSPAYRTFLEGLTATHAGHFFVEAAKAQGIPLREHRGSPENVGQGLEAVHPVIRTNPVTGWKGVFVNRGFTKRINELSKDESDAALEYLFNHINQNHDLQVRFRWEPRSIAIWDNRSTWHTATKDFENEQPRVGNRAVSIGEKPYFDPESVSRLTGLRERKEAAVKA